jgi:hypothetical protein
VKLKKEIFLSNFLQKEKLFSCVLRAKVKKKNKKIRKKCLFNLPKKLWGRPRKISRSKKTIVKQKNCFLEFIYTLVGIMQKGTAPPTTHDPPPVFEGGNSPFPKIEKIEKIYIKCFFFLVYDSTNQSYFRSSDENKMRF